jgi:H/ACA ribonucleoprotein complex non-core subunit NAF1
MRDSSPPVDAASAQDDLQIPPAKRPCLDGVSASSELQDSVLDEGSDFYNTPLNGRTPPHNPNPDNTTNSQPATPQKPPQIPGLSLSGGLENAATQLHPPDEPLKANTGQSPLRQVVTSTTSPSSEEPMSALTAGVSKTRMDTSSPKEQKVPPSATANDGESMDGLQATDTAMLVAQTVVQEGEGTLPELNNLPVGEVQPEEGGEPEWEADSSPYESSSSGSSDTSSSDDSDEEDYPLLDPEEQARLLMAADGVSDDEGDARDAKKEIRTANEKPEEVVPIPDITVTPDMKVEMLGNIETVLDNLALVKANISGEYQVLDAGSVLCLADLSVIGVVSETLGRVEQPLYTIRFTNAEDMKKKGVEKGVPVFYVFDHSKFVFTQPLKGLKGSDASNIHDEEVAEDEIEFSDDEAEAEYRRQLKQKRQQQKEARGGLSGKPKSRRGGAPGPSGLRTSELPYDDAGVEDGYTPLVRPRNYQEMMDAQEPAPREPYPDSAHRGGRGNFRNRGYDRRGRGGRGRGGGGGYQHHRDDGYQRHGHEQNGPAGYSAPPAHQNPVYSQGGFQQQQPAPMYSNQAPQHYPSFQQQPPQAGQGNAFLPTQYPGFLYQSVFLC